MYDPVANKSLEIERNVTNPKVFDKLVSDKYFSERLSIQKFTKSMDQTDAQGQEIKWDGVLNVRISIKDEFEIKAPKINNWWYHAMDCLEHHDHWNSYYMLGYAITLALALFSSYHLIFKTTPSSEAHKILKMVQRDMTEKNMFRNGLTLSGIYDWYSSEIRFPKQEFYAKVIPHIEDQLKTSGKFVESTNRKGQPVWKIE